MFLQYLYFFGGNEDSRAAYRAYVHRAHGHVVAWHVAVVHVAVVHGCVVGVVHCYWYDLWARLVGLGV